MAEDGQEWLSTPLAQLIALVGGCVFVAILFGVRWLGASSISSQEEEEIPAHPKEEEDASMQHVESGWTLVSDRRRREWVSTHPAGGW